MEYPIGSMVLVYWPTFGWFIGPMLVNIPYMEHLGIDTLVMTLTCLKKKWPSGNDSYIAIEHGPLMSIDLRWVFPFHMAIFHSYVSLPKGANICHKHHPVVAIIASQWGRKKDLDWDSTTFFSKNTPNVTSYHILLLCLFQERYCSMIYIYTYANMFLKDNIYM